MKRARAVLLGLCVAAGCDGGGGSGSRDGGTSLDEAGVALPPAEWPPRTGSARVEPTLEGHFVVTREVFRPEDRAAVTAVALGDCDGDGRLDALPLGSGLTLTAYRGLGDGRFEAVTSEPPRASYAAAVFADVDGDGREDLVAADRAVTVLRNEGGCRFGPARVVASLVFDNARQVLVADVNRDGLADLSVTQRNAERSPHRLLVARGDGGYDEFAPRPTPYSPGERREGYFIGFGMYYEDLDDDGALDLFALLDQRQSWFSWGERAGELGQLPDAALTMALGAADAMSVSPLDFDRDGRVDWFVSGVFSRSRLLWHRGGRDLRDAAARAGVDGVGDYFAWGSYGFDADLDGWPDVLVLREGPDGPPEVPTVPGPVDLFLNRRDGTFAEVGERVVQQRLRAKGLQCGALSPRGPVGCFVMDRAGPLLLVNGLRPRGRQALVRLRGAVSAFDATGARVSIDDAVPAQVFVAGGQGTYGGEHARTLQLPLGDRDVARVTVRWPSGLVQRAVEVRADVLTTIAEPAAVALSARVLPADGAATAEVTVDPRALGGGRVELALAGDGQWAGDATTDGEGTIHRVIRAPTAPGEGRVVVTVDGLALRVRPRVLFTRAR